MRVIDTLLHVIRSRYIEVSLVVLFVEKIFIGLFLPPTSNKQQEKTTSKQNKNNKHAIQNKQTNKQNTDKGEWGKFSMINQKSPYMFPRGN